MKIVILGTGNVATQLALAFLKVGENVVQVYNHAPESAAVLAGLLSCPFTTNKKEIVPDADVYLISVRDDAIASVLKGLKFKNGLVAHTSAMVDKDVLKEVAPNYGVFYPLLSIKKELDTDFTNVPIFIDGGNGEMLDILKALGKRIAHKVIRTNHHRLQTIHLAAVLANNFTNHLFVIAEDILKKENIPFEVLMPLMDQHFEKLKNNISPSTLQTGPAIRGDKKTMDKHLQLLKKDKELTKLYQLFSELIQRN